MRKIISLQLILRFLLSLVLVSGVMPKTLAAESGGTAQPHHVLPPSSDAASNGHGIAVPQSSSPSVLPDAEEHDVVLPPLAELGAAKVTPSEVAPVSSVPTPEAPHAVVTSPAPVLPSVKAAKPATPAWYAERDKAVLMARHGEAEKASVLLVKLQAQHPTHTGLTADTVAVLGWAGHDAEAVKYYLTLPASQQPDYVLAAMGRVYRNMGQPEKALEIYRKGEKDYPQNTFFAEGEIRSLTDMKRFYEALACADAALHRSGRRVDLLLAASDAAKQSNKVFDALVYVEDAMRLAPQNKDVLHVAILAVDAIGAAEQAHKMADRNPNTLTPAEYRRVLGDEASALVRWGTLEPVSEAHRYVQTDRAIALLEHLIAQWSKQPEARADLLRARFDRLVALRNRSRMQEVVADYEVLSGAHIQVPSYALTSVADAYLYLRQPERARDLYLTVLATHPDDFDAKVQLFYAYLECQDYDKAYQTIDTAVAEQPIWIRMKGEPNPLPNTRRSQADLASGLARLYGDELADAHERVGAIAALAPNDPRNRAALGTVLAARGLLREAKQEYAISKAIEPTANLSAETGLATTDLDLQDFQSAEARVKDLIARYPESLEAQRLNRDWEAHNMAEWQIEAGYAFRPSTSAAGGEGFSVAKQIYSAPLHYNWRLFGSTFYAHEHEPSGEGNAVLKRYLAGVEYRDAGLIASLAPTYSDYHSTGRVGVVGEGAYALNDRWTVGGRGEVFARNTPLRALNAGVTANAIGGDVTWRQNEQRSVTMNGEYMPFSDGNNRLGFYGFYTERLWTHPVFKVEGVFNLAESQNSKDANRLYFNPSHDFLGLGGLKVTHKLYHRYETRYEHSVTLMPGAYWQEHYGTKAALTARYDQRFVYDETFEAGWGVNYTHQAFDGKAEDDVSLMFDLLGRF